MELPPPHVLLQLDAIIVAQRESDGNRAATGDAPPAEARSTQRETKFRSPGSQGRHAARSPFVWYLDVAKASHAARDEAHVASDGVGLLTVTRGSATARAA